MEDKKNQGPDITPGHAIDQDLSKITEEADYDELIHSESITVSNEEDSMDEDEVVHMPHNEIPEAGSEIDADDLIHNPAIPPEDL